MIEDDLKLPENRYVYSPESEHRMPRASGANIAIFIFLVIVFALLFVAAIGYLSGAWQVAPT